MNRMKTIALVVPLFTLLAAGCSEDPNPVGTGGAGTGGAGSTGGAGMGGAGMGGMAGMPAVPTLGAQIDRMGRPGVNTALVALAESSGMTLAGFVRGEGMNVYCGAERIT